MARLRVALWAVEKVEKRLWRGSFSDKLRKRPCGSSGERLRSACGASYSAILRKRRYVPSGDALLLNCAKRLSTARRALSTARSASQPPEGHSQPREAHSQPREAPLNLFLNKKYRIFLVVSRSCIIFAEIFNIDRNLNIYHYDRRKTDTGWR